MGKKIAKNIQVLRSRSLGPEYMTPELDYESEFLEQKIREGKYGLDLYYGDNEKDTALAWYLPRFSEKLRHLEQRLRREGTTEKEMSLVPYEPLPHVVQEVKKDLAISKASSREVGKKPQDYARPSQKSLVDMFHPTLGPYYGRIWSLPDYLNPISGRDRSLSEPLHVTSGWTDWKSYEKPYSSYSLNTLIKT
ncbi:hypothetical protein Pcinc_025283 [Petrolisthes cinctipes]|uniref:Uncharacterized protein n=1 Tax=Petrolisthes cinctipes TaxID=88211 RepID=A0AAE1KC55_PETCI|nr:hypothetical protein Pcinc_025283 [Petrolisthes cinctipes]